MSGPRFLVVGSPIDHSLSPTLLGQLAAPHGGYGRREVTQLNVEALLNEVRAGALDGLSVTRPLKETMVTSLDGLSPLASRVGAVNCVVREGEKAIGHNTDVGGIKGALQAHGRPFQGARVLILGAGGVARAALQAVRQGDAALIVVAARREEQAAALLRSPGPLPEQAVALSALGKEAYDVVLQCTPVGQGTEEDVLPSRVPLSSATVVLDLVYEPLTTALLRRAKSEGALALDGLWPLIFQAAEQAKLFGWQVPETWPALARAAVLKELRTATDERSALTTSS